MTQPRQIEADLRSLDTLRGEIDRRRPPGWSRPVLAVLTLLAVAGTATAITIWVGPEEPIDRPTASSPNDPAAAQAAGSDPKSTPPAPPFAAHGAAYETVSQIGRASDLVVIGTVTESRVGDVIGEGPEDSFPTRILHTTVTIEEVLRGSSSKEIVVATDELAYQGPGIEDWRKPEHRVLLFLSESLEGEGAYVPVEFAYPQAVYFISGQRIEMTVGGDVMGLSERIASLTLPELRDRVGPDADS